MRDKRCLTTSILDPTGIRFCVNLDLKAEDDLAFARLIKSVMDGSAALAWLLGGKADVLFKGSRAPSFFEGVIVFHKCRPDLESVRRHLGFIGTEAEIKEEASN